MVADQLRDYLEAGNIRNSVNFPEAYLEPKESAWRIAICNANVPNMVGQISTALAHAGVNISDLLNKSRGEIAYTLVDADSAVPPAVLEEIRAIEGVLGLRFLGRTALPIHARRHSSNNQTREVTSDHGWPQG